MEADFTKGFCWLKPVVLINIFTLNILLINMPEYQITALLQLLFYLSGMISSAVRYILEVNVAFFCTYSFGFDKKSGFLEYITIK